MSIRDCTGKVFKGFYSLSEAAAWIGYVTLAGIILIVFGDVGGRYLFNKPLPGSYELVEQSTAILGGFAIMYAAVKGGHVAIDILLSRLSARIRRTMERIFSFLGFGTLVVLAYQVYLYTLDVVSSETTSVLHISTAPFSLLLAVALFLCGVTFLIQTFRPQAPTGANDGEKGARI